MGVLWKSTFPNVLSGVPQELILGLLLFIHLPYKTTMFLTKSVHNYAHEAIVRIGK